jgi:hypothetical protein
MSFKEIELKSLILAQIERWRNALHMQVERQRGACNLAASGERVSNASERTQSWGITIRKLIANTAYDLRVKGGDRKTSRDWSGRYRIS